MVVNTLLKLGPPAENNIAGGGVVVSTSGASDGADDLAVRIDVFLSDDHIADSVGVLHASAIFPQCNDEVIAKEIELRIFDGDAAEEFGDVCFVVESGFIFTSNFGFGGFFLCLRLVVL